MRFYALLTMIIILIAGSFGCSESEVEKVDPGEVERMKSELEAANQRIGEFDLLLKEKNEVLQKERAENIRLSAENSKLEDDFNMLKINHDRLSESHKELDAWSKKLADGYGAGVWYMDESDRPAFIKSMKDINGVIQELNKKFQEENLPEIILNKIADKTAYIGTDNDEMLTRRMGSFGARAYINAVTYSITSVEDIDCIWLEIKEGDHAVPGEYCR